MRPGERLKERLLPHLCEDGVYLPSSTWFIVANKELDAVKRKDRPSDTPVEI